jgi:MFS family permease
MYSPRSETNAEDPDSPPPANDNGRSPAADGADKPAEDAADPAPEPPLLTPAFVALLIAQAFFGFADALFVLLPKLLVVGYGAGAREIGLVMGAFGVASLIAIPGISPAVRRLGRIRAMVAADLLLAASAFAFLFIGSAGPFAAILRGLHGIAWSLLFAAGTSLVADLAPPSRLGQAIGLYGAANLAMHAIAPALAEPLAGRFGARVVFALAGVSASIAAARIRRLPIPASCSTAAPAPSTGPVELGTRRAALIVLMVGGLAAAGMTTFIAPFALAHGIQVVRGFFMAYMAAALAVRIGAARFTDRAGYRRAALGSSLAYGAVVIATGCLGPAHMVLLGALFGLAHGVVFPAIMALIIGGVTQADRPRLLAFANGAINLGVTGVGLLGAIAARAGYPAVYLGTGALTIAAAFLLLPPRGRASAAST